MISSLCCKSSYEPGPNPLHCHDVFSFAGYNGTQASTVSLPSANTLAELQQKQEDADQSCTDDNVGRNKKDDTNAEVSDKKYGVSLFLILSPQKKFLNSVWRSNILYCFICVMWTFV